MDRQAKLSRLKFTLTELVEQLKSDAFDPSDHKQTVFLMGEVNKLCHGLGLAELSLIETDNEHGGRVTLYHPGMTFSAPFQSDFRVTKKTTVAKAMWSAMRQPEAFPILSQWVRWIDHTMTQQVSDVEWSKPMTKAAVVKELHISSKTIDRWSRDADTPYELRECGKGWWQYRVRSR